MYREHILQCERLEIQPVGGIVVGRHRFGITVDDDGLEAQLLQALCRVDAAVVEFDTLSYTVGSSSEDHYLLAAVRLDLRLFIRIVSRVVVRAVLRAAHMDGIVGLRHAELFPSSSYIVLRNLQYLCQIPVRESVLLRLYEPVIFGKPALVSEQGFFFLHQLLHLLYEVFLDMGRLEHFVHGSSLTQSLVHLEVPLRVGCGQHTEQLLLRMRMEILHEAQTVSPLFERAYCLLKSFFVVLSYGHDLSYGSHLSAEPVLHALELFKGPSGKLDHDEIPSGLVLGEVSPYAVLQIL